MNELMELYAAEQFVAAAKNSLFNKEMLKRMELHAKVVQLQVEHANKKYDAARNNFTSFLFEEKGKKKTSFVPRVEIV